MERFLGSTLLRQSGIYTLFGGLAGLFPVLALPLITRRVSPADYGLCSLFSAVVFISMPLVGMGLETAVGRRYVDREQIDFRRYVTTALALTVAFALGVLALALAGYSWLVPVLKLPRAWAAAWVAAALSETVLGVVLVLLQMEERVVQHGWWRIGRTAVLQGSVVVAVLCGGTGWRALVSAQALSFAAVGLTCLAWLKHRGYLVPRLAAADARAALAYGAPLLPHMLGSAAMVSIDRLLISRMVGIDAVGLFAVGAQFGQMMFVPATSLGRAWIPWYYARVKATFPAASRVVPQTIAAAAALLAVALVLGIGGYVLVPILLGPSYAAALPVFFWFVGAWTAHGGFGLASAYLFYSHRTGWISAATAITVLSNIGFTLWLIPHHGIVGAGQAAFIAYMIEFVLALCLSTYFQHADRRGAVQRPQPLIATKHAA